LFLAFSTILGFPKLLLGLPVLAGHIVAKPEMSSVLFFFRHAMRVPPLRFSRP